MEVKVTSTTNDNTGSSKKTTKRNRVNKTHISKRIKTNEPSKNPSEKSPIYPDFSRPTSEECRDVRDRLMSLHGFPQEFEEFRRNDELGTSNSGLDVKGDEVSGIARIPGSDVLVVGSVLDGLVSILLSQNTTDANSRKAFQALKSTFPTWDEVHIAESKSVEAVIKCGGLAEIKTSRIKNILKKLLDEKGKICLEYLRNMSVDKIKTELYRFNGIGPKSVVCLLMFYLQKDDFPVDTHVFRITKSIGWVPSTADREKAYLHLNQRIPDCLKFDLNCLFVTHGKHCQTCPAKNGQYPANMAGSDRISKEKVSRSRPNEVRLPDF